MPSRASVRMTTSTSPTSSGSSADVTSSKSITCGLHHQRPRDGDPLLLSAGELVRVLVAFSSSPTLARSSCARPSASRRGIFRIRPRREREVVERGQLREEVELLEDDADALPDGGDVDALARDLLSLEEDPPGLDRLEQVDAAQERALSAAARPDDAEHLAGLDAQVDAVEDDVVAEALVDVLHADHGGAIRTSSLDCCRRNAHCQGKSRGNCVRPVKALTSSLTARTRPGSRRRAKGDDHESRIRPPCSARRCLGLALLGGSSRGLVHTD